VFPLAGAESNLMVPLSERGELHRSPAVAAVGAALTDAAGIAPGDAALREIYSCFPAAVQIQCAELGIDVDGDLTVTGGMHFAGGPLNSFSLQALAALVPTLRERHDEVALVTSVSGMMTKFGAGLWSASPNDAFRSIDVTESARAATATRVVDGEAAGTAVVVGSTVGYVHGDATEAVVIADVPSGTRAVAVSRDAEVIAAFRGEEWVGRSVMVDGPVLRLG
jgi:acetyl-CoA C-acetyltransferase